MTLPTRSMRKKGGNRMCLVNHPAPDFDLEGYFKGEFKRYKLSDYKGKWVILLFYPLDFNYFFRIIPFKIWVSDK